MPSIWCPRCKRWLADCEEYGRASCRQCGYEVTVRVKAKADG